MKSVDAHNHLVYPDRDGRSSFVTDPQMFIDDGSIDQMWFLSVGDCIRHSFGDINEAVLDLARKFPDFAIPFAYLDFHKSPDIVDDF